jgi:hypothetical protein
VVTSAAKTGATELTKKAAAVIKETILLVFFILFKSPFKFFLFKLGLADTL